MKETLKKLIAIVSVLIGLAAITLSGMAQTGLDLVDVDLMFVSAHPDDDTGIMATFARYLLDEGFRATVITATSGEGGGNAIGPEAGRALGLIRAEEERRALELVGVSSPQFLGLRDFYFTLSAEETARRWGDSYVCDVVRYVRLQRPEVMVTMWPGPRVHTGTIRWLGAPQPSPSIRRQIQTSALSSSQKSISSLSSLSSFITPFFSPEERSRRLRYPSIPMLTLPRQTCAMLT